MPPAGDPFQLFRGEPTTKASPPVLLGSLKECLDAAARSDGHHAGHAANAALAAPRARSCVRPRCVNPSLLRFDELDRQSEQANLIELAKYWVGAVATKSRYEEHAWPGDFDDGLDASREHGRVIADGVSGD